MRDLRFYEISRAEAAGADFDGFSGAILQNLDLHQIGTPYLPRLVISVTDVVSRKISFSAQFAFSRHYRYLPYETISNRYDFNLKTVSSVESI